MAEKTFAYTTTRHYRYIFFVSENTTKDVLFKLFKINLRLWGGRYNPIIPVIKNVISEEYKSVINNYDPDFIFHTEDINPDIIRNLGFFHPAKYISLNHAGFHEIIGVDTLYLLYQNQNIGLLGQVNDHLIKDKLKEFYEINWGLLDLNYEFDSRVTRTFEQIQLAFGNFQNLIQHILKRNVYRLNDLASKLLNNIFLKAKNYAATDYFEIIIYDNKNPFDDLIYFWNRQLYLGPDSNNNQILISNEDIKDAFSQPYIEELLKILVHGAKINLHSETIAASILQELKDEVLQPVCKYTHFYINKNVKFPYEIQYEIKIPSKDGIKQHQQILLDKNDLLRLPELDFSLKQEISSYIVDVQLQSSDEQKSNIKLPYKTYWQLLFCHNLGRINDEHDISLFISKEKGAIDIRIPSDYEIIRQRIQFVQIEGNAVHTGIHHIDYSNAGAKLNAFLKLFDSSFSSYIHFLRNRFWLNIFRCKSEFKDKSNIHNNKGIFNYLDLEKEHALYYEKYEKEITEWMIKNNELVEDFKDRIYPEFKRDDFEKIDDDLVYLTQIDGLFLGFKVLCKNCGSKLWYSLGELNHKINCKGCLYEIRPPAKSILYYKINDTILNNIMCDRKNESSSFDGNYTVLRTLSTLISNPKHCALGFSFCPPLVYSKNQSYENKKDDGDIDILAIQDGNFIIGEAKDSAKEFTNKVLDQLVDLGTTIQPDKIILAYNEGKLHKDKIENLKSRLPNCEIFEHKIYPAYFDFDALFHIK